MPNERSVEQLILDTATPIAAAFVMGKKPREITPESASQLGIAAVLIASALVTAAMGAAQKLAEMGAKA